jgi:hypothetical protein
MFCQALKLLPKFVKGTNQVSTGAYAYHICATYLPELMHARASFYFERV